MRSLLKSVQLCSESIPVNALSSQPSNKACKEPVEICSNVYRKHSSECFQSLYFKVIGVFPLIKCTVSHSHLFRLLTRSTSIQKKDPLCAFGRRLFVLSLCRLRVTCHSPAIIPAEVPVLAVWWVMSLTNQPNCGGRMRSTIYDLWSSAAPRDSTERCPCGQSEVWSNLSVCVGVCQSVLLDSAVEQCIVVLSCRGVTPVTTSSCGITACGITVFHRPRSSSLVYGTLFSPAQINFLHLIKDASRQLSGICLLSSLCSVSLSPLCLSSCFLPHVKVGFIPSLVQNRRNHLRCVKINVLPSM